MTATAIMFRTVTKGDFAGTVEACILDAPVSAPHFVMMYTHIGQHGEGTWEYVRRETREATPQERKALLKELQGIYGTIRVVTTRGRKVA